MFIITVMFSTLSSNAIILVHQYSHIKLYHTTINAHLSPFQKLSTKILISTTFVPHFYTSKHAHTHTQHFTTIKNLQNNTKRLHGIKQPHWHIHNYLPTASHSPLQTHKPTLTKHHPSTHSSHSHWNPHPRSTIGSFYLFYVLSLLISIKSWSFFHYLYFDNEV